VFLLEKYGLIYSLVCSGRLSPQPNDKFLCWRRAVRAAPKEHRKGLNSIIILVTWEIWKHRNTWVFEGRRPSVPAVIQEAAYEGAIC
jgi:hypothetical protein